MEEFDFYGYVDSRRVTDATWNVTGMGDEWQGKYHIPDDEYEPFLEALYTHIFEAGKSCALLERQGVNGPVLIDLDFRYTGGGPLVRRFTDEQIRAFVSEYAAALAHFVEFTDVSTLEFFVTVKPGPEPDKTVHKDGIHIVCPSITVGSELKCVIRGWLLQNKVIERIFGPTGIINTADDCLDVTVIRPNNPNNWFPYGACKPNKAQYTLTHVYSVDANRTPVTLVDQPLSRWTNQDLVFRLSVLHGHDTPTEYVVRDSAEWDPLVAVWGAPTRQKRVAGGTQGIQPPTPSPMMVDASGGGGPLAGGASVRAPPSSEDVALAYRLVAECLSPERRCGSYQDWINTAMCLKNIANRDESFVAWMEITHRTDPAKHKKATMSEGELREKWRHIPVGTTKCGRAPLLLGSLHFWAREDDPIKYRAILSDANITNIVNVQESGTHVAVAELVYRMYRHEFRCSPPKRGATAAQMDWFQFEGHTWRSIKTNFRIRERLSYEVRSVYLEAAQRISNRILALPADDTDQAEMLKKRRDNLTKIVAQLQDKRFKDCVLVEVTEKFYDEEFLEQLDVNPTTVGFNNGVLELRHAGDDGEPHIHFRPGRPDDCISFQMGRSKLCPEGIPYIPYDPEHPAPEHTEIIDFYRMLYPDPELREYVITLHAACLEGCNREQKFYVNTGSGSNGKGVTDRLMILCWGEYRGTLSTTALTRKRNDSEAANPAMIAIKNKRYVSMSEPDENEKLNSSLMKQISGEDIVKARGLFKDQDEFVVMARIFMLCNDLPPVTSNDGGTWRRLRVIPHVAKFVDPGVATDPARHIYTKDLLMEGKLQRWRPYFVGFLAWYFEHRYLRGGLKEPDLVQAASRSYKEENDAFALFVGDCIAREDGAELRTNDIMARYRDWSKYNPSKKTLQRKEIVTKLAEQFGKPMNGDKVFVGLRLVMDDDATGDGGTGAATGYAGKS